MSKSSIGYVICNDTINLFVNGQSWTIDPSHINYTLVRKELNGKKRASVLTRLASIKKCIEKFMRGKIKVDVDQGIVTYNNTKVEPVISSRIIEFMQNGLNATPLIKFLDKLMSNPSARAVNELYKFLEGVGLALSPDGDFYAYKSIRKDWLDHYSRTFVNKPGKKIKIPRNTVDDDCNNTCSYGIHVGHFAYAQNFYSGSSRIVLVKINPRDVVSVPNETGAQKCRVCEYKVVKEYTKNEPIQDALYVNGR